jgi:hypothetical protein
MAEKKHSDRIKQALDEYNQQHPDNPIVESIPVKDDRNPIVKLWDKIGKTGQVIALVAGILTGLTTIKPYAEDAITFMGDFVYSVETTRKNTERIIKLEKSNEVNMSITKSQLHPYFHKNPDGVKVKLYQTNPVHGKKMTYHFVDSLKMPLVANENLESGYWYTIDASGNYSEIRK